VYGRGEFVSSVEIPTALLRTWLDYTIPAFRARLREYIETVLS